MDILRDGVISHVMVLRSDVTATILHGCRHARDDDRRADAIVLLQTSPAAGGVRPGEGLRRGWWLTPVLVVSGRAGDGWAAVWGWCAGGRLAGCFLGQAGVPGPDDQDQHGKQHLWSDR